MLVEGTGRTVESRLPQKEQRPRTKEQPPEPSVVFALLVDLAIACDMLRHIHTHGGWSETVGGGWSFRLFEGRGRVRIAQAMIARHGKIVGFATATTEHFSGGARARDACIEELQECCAAIAEPEAALS